MVPKRRLGSKILTSARFVDEISSPYGDSERGLPNDEPIWMYATVRPRSYLCRTGNIVCRGTDFTIECAKKYGKPHCIIHYLDREAIIGLKNVISRLRERAIVEYRRSS